MTAIQSPRTRSFARNLALGLALVVSACASAPPAPPPKPAEPVAASVLQLSYTVDVATVEADTDLGDLDGMIRQALMEGGYAIANNSADADVVLEASLVSTRVEGGMVVYVNGEERVQRNVKLTLRAHPPGDSRVVDQSTRSFSTKEPRIPQAEVSGALNDIAAGSHLASYASTLAADAERAAQAKADEAAAQEAQAAKKAADAAAAEELAAKTRGCEQLRDSTAETIVKSFREDREVALRQMVLVYGDGSNLCDVEETTRNRDALRTAIEGAPAAQRGDSSTRLTELAKKSLVRANVEGATFVRAVATGKKKNLVNEYGLSMGTTRRVSILTEIGDKAACFEVRGDWRVSTLHEDRDEPEFVRLDWYDNSPAAHLVACPKR